MCLPSTLTVAIKKSNMYKKKKRCHIQRCTRSSVYGLCVPAARVRNPMKNTAGPPLITANNSIQLYIKMSLFNFALFFSLLLPFPQSLRKFFRAYDSSFFLSFCCDIENHVCAHAQFLFIVAIILIIYSNPAIFFLCIRNKAIVNIDKKPHSNRYKSITR